MHLIILLTNTAFGLTVAWMEAGKRNKPSIGIKALPIF